MPKSARKSEGVEPSSSSDRAPACVCIQRNVFCLGDKSKETVWGPAHTPPVRSALPSGRPR
jgi:hypothetical protein